MSEPKVWRPGELWGIKCKRHGTEHVFWIESDDEGLLVFPTSRDATMWVGRKGTTGYDYQVIPIITGDPADRKRIAELEGAMKEVMERAGRFDMPEGTTGLLGEIGVIYSLLRQALQSTEVRDGE